MKNVVKKNKKKSLILLYALLGVSIAGILFFTAWMGYDYFRDWQSQRFYTAVAADVETRPHSSMPSPAIVENIDVSEDGVEELGEDIEEELWVPYVDFEELAERFVGIKAWIKLEGTAINYPIMQWTDNYHFLGTLPDGTSHRSGSIFLDFRNSPDFTDRNTLIYGHESRTDDMFGALKHFRNQDFADEHNIFYIHTPYRDYHLIAFAGYLVDSAREQPRINFADDEDFMIYIEDIRSRSLFSSDVEVTAEDRIVSLCTCAYDFPNARWVVVGKLGAIE